MLKDEEIATLCDIQQSIAFADDKRGQVEKLIVEGYVQKVGDIYELTSKGERSSPIEALVSMKRRGTVNSSVLVPFRSRASPRGPRPSVFPNGLG